MNTKIELLKTKLAEASRIMETSSVGFDKSHIEQGKAPANFWLALVNVLDELRHGGTIIALADWEWLLENYNVPYVVRYFLLHGYVHPMHYSELKLLADYETWHANAEKQDHITEAAQKLHEGVYAIFGRECSYHLYALRNWCATSDIPYASLPTIETFVWVFGKDKVPDVDEAQQWLKALGTAVVHTGGDVSFGTWCELYIRLFAFNGLNEAQTGEACKLLEKYFLKDNFFYHTLDMGDLVEEIYRQCELYKNTQDEDLQSSLLDRWYRIVRFYAHIADGDSYYTIGLGEESGVIEKIWRGSSIACKNRLKYGLCFLNKDAADKFVEIL